jgi:hypothetical protein
VQTLIHMTLAGKMYPMYFSTHAAYQLDMYLRRNQMGNVGTFMNRLEEGRKAGLKNELGLIELSLMLWACIEGGRMKAGTRATPYTVEEVNGIIDDHGGIMMLADEIEQMMLAAAAKNRPDDKDGEVNPPKKAKAGTTGAGGKRSTPKRSV